MKGFAAAFVLLANSASAAPQPFEQGQQGAATDKALAPFAETLAARRLGMGPGYWQAASGATAWRAIAASTSDTRQEARWNYARAMIDSGRFAEAEGALEVMASDEPDVALTGSFALARARARIGMGRYGEGIELLGTARLANQAEACAWRLVALASSGFADQAYLQMNCALPAINARKGAARHIFIFAAASAAIGSGHAPQADIWLSALPLDDQLANILRGYAAARMNKNAAARSVWLAAAAGPVERRRLSARLALAEFAMERGAVSRPDLNKALKLANKVRYRWRGDKLERRATLLAYRTATALGDDRAALEAGATLLRYHVQSSSTLPVLRALQTRLAGALQPASKVPLLKAAGMFWDFRDLVPAGAEGDLMASNFATRLQRAGLYRRAADLLQHQMLQRAVGITVGPLSIRVATLYVLAGEAPLAMKILRQTEAIPFPEEMRWDRQRIEAIALANIGRTDEALAILESIPDSAAIAAEIEWRRHNWQALAANPDRVLPRPGQLTALEQTIVLRQAVAHAMLGDEPGLARLRNEFGASFANLPNGEAFVALTGPVAERDTQMLAEALGKMPGASPAGKYADLLMVNKEG
ncbi:hypothetical protein [Sphingorhabdus sp. M41]|uniref:hypothetical protein n=1 Tax=Sphingorhabdus sp. M41 TaxID=1806885 RepID=UPI00078D6170|nr:hypothetical protein [Sphingorhabdus sp. M41]AMO72592.1 hypothetical protein AZE99_12690 [Sphingorhabdus sp. M41]